MNLHGFIKMLRDSYEQGDWEAEGSHIEEEEFGGSPYDAPSLHDTESLDKNFEKFIADVTAHAEVVGGRLRIYRALNLKSVDKFIKSLKERQVGVSWSYTRDGAQAIWGGDGTTYVLEGLVNPAEVNEAATVYLNVMLAEGGESEKEIRLAEGASVTLLGMSSKKREIPLGKVKVSAESEEEADALTVHPDMKVEPDQETLDEVRETFADAPDGVHDRDHYVAKVEGGEVVGFIVFTEVITTRGKVPRDELYEKSCRIGYIWVEPEHRKQGIGKEMLLYAVHRFGIVESNLEANSGGDALWKSLKGAPGIVVKYPEDKDYGYIAYLRDRVVGSESDAVVVDPNVTVTPNVKKAEHVFKSKGEGLHSDANAHMIAMKKDGKVVGIISFSEWRNPSKKVKEEEIFFESARIDYVWVDPAYRNRGVAREMLVYAIKHLGIVESNRSVNTGGNALWDSIEDTPGIVVEDPESHLTNEDSGNFGYIGYREDIVVADIGSGGGGPNSKYERIPEVDFENGMPEELEPYREYPWSPKSKDSYPVDLPDAPNVDDMSFPFSGQILHRLPFSRPEERVNKNPNADQKKPVGGSFLRKVRAAPIVDVPQDEGPKAPPKVPGKPGAQESGNPKPAAPGRKQTFFPEFYAKVKQSFPEIKQWVNDPPTYVWNPKEGKDSKIDNMKIKELLKVKFPKLVWTAGGNDGVEKAVVDFPDGTYASLAIGQNLDHLTVVYYVD